MSYNTLRKYFIFLSIVTVILFLSAHVSNASTNTLISLDFKEKSIDEAFKKLSELSGYKISINKEFSGQTVDVSLKDLNILECLKKMLTGYNNTIEINEGNKIISVIIYGENDAKKLISKKSNPNDQEVIPADDADGTGLTKKEMDKILSNQSIYAVTLDTEILPADKLGEPGIKLRDFENGSLQNISEINDSTEVLPPIENGKPGATFKDINDSISMQKIINLKDEDIEIIPPESPGMKGVTLKEINAIRNVDTAPLSR
ncbi:MAG: hypothetical protein HQK76_10550 [Desulfobacterales bacterium]|nr:hypothetical protein [Desulfobacterales bacterium]